MLKKMRDFDLSFWLLQRKANYYTFMADRAVKKYKKKLSQN